MSVAQSDVVDLISENPATREIALIMAESRDWNAAPEAVKELEKKFSGYAYFILAGGMAAKYPQWVDRPVRIRLTHAAEIPAAVEAVLRRWAARLAEIPVGVVSSRFQISAARRLLSSISKRMGPTSEPDRVWAPDPNCAGRLLPRDRFVLEYQDAIKTAFPGSQITPVKDHFVVRDVNGKESRFFVDNAYLEFLGNSENKTAILRRFANAMTAAPEMASSNLDRARIVPVLKDKAWETEIRAGLQQQGVEKPPATYFERYNEELIIAYAEDLPTSIRYLTQDQMAKLDLKPGELRALACENLERLIPPWHIRGGNGTYMITAGGNYEACLLLIENVWTSPMLKVNGEIVAAVPSRDVLLVTGSNDRDGLQKVKGAIQTIQTKAAYRLTTSLFIYRNGRFEVFKPAG